MFAYCYGSKESLTTSCEAEENQWCPKLVDKYVPQEYHNFYNSIAGDEEVFSETDESDEN